MGVGKEATAKMIAARRTLLFLIRYMEGMRVEKYYNSWFLLRTKCWSFAVLLLAMYDITRGRFFMAGQKESVRRSLLPLSPPAQK